MLSAIENSSTLQWLGKQLFSSDRPAAYLDPLLGAINPLWIRGFVPAQVMAVTRETADTQTFHLKPAARWGGFRAGQHVNAMIEVDGVQQHRTFSLSSTPQQWHSEGTVTLTIKRLAEGRVTNWMHSRLNKGATIGLGEAFGSFALPEKPEPLLYIAGGSGITPVLSQLATLADQKYTAPVTLLYYVRTRLDVIGADMLEALAARWTELTVQIFYTGETGPSARLSQAHLATTTDIAKRRCYLCGPMGLMECAETLLEEAGVDPEQMQVTYFTAPKSAPVSADLGGKVTFGKSDFNVDATGDAPLLEIAEAASLKPQYGCRMGICHQCSCRKTSGTVVNRLTGKTSGPDEETIQLCISVPQGPVTVDL